MFRFLVLVLAFSGASAIYPADEGKYEFDRHLADVAQAMKQTMNKRAGRPTAITLQTIQDMNPQQSKDACEACVAGQHQAMNKDVLIPPAQASHIKALEALNAAKITEKQAMQKQVDALDGYNTAKVELAAAQTRTAELEKTVSSASAIEVSTNIDAAAALKDAQDACVGFSLPVINMQPSE